VLGPLLYSVYADDLDDVLPNVVVKKFADDTKLYVKYTTSEHSRCYGNLQHAINAVLSWCNDNGFLLNTKKCVVIHFGHHNPHSTYTLNGNALDNVRVVKDLGIYVDTSLSFDYHNDFLSSKARRLAGLVYRTFRCRSAQILLPVYKSLVRPIMEYGCVVWSPYTVHHIEALEHVQRRFSKRIRGLSNTPYSERLWLLQLPTLELRRLYFDIVTVYKIMTGLMICRCSFSLVSSTRSMRGHCLKLQKKFHRLDCRKHFFSERAVEHWNALPQCIVTAPSLFSFKNQLRSHLGML
jgi:hypothetical protein